MLRILLLVLALSGCSANWDSIHRDIDVNSGKGAFVDIKQRGVFISKPVVQTIHQEAVEDNQPANPSSNPVDPAQPSQAIKPTQGNASPSEQVKKPKASNYDETDTRTILCAEPSPDSLSAYTTELAAQIKTKHGDEAGFSSGFLESVAFVGLRTQTIQVLRDVMYRNCEAYMNGAVDKYGFDLLMRRAEKSMVALLAIESLTGVVKVPSVALGTSGNAALDSTLSSLQKSLEEKNDQLKKNTAKKEADEKDKTDKCKTDDDKKGDTCKGLDTEISTLTDTNTKITDDISNIKVAIQYSKGMSVSGTTSINFDTNAQHDITKPSETGKIATTVEKIVNKITDADDFPQICLSHYLSREDHFSNASSTQQNQLDKICETYFKDYSVRQLGTKGVYVKLINTGLELSKPAGYSLNDLTNFINAINKLPVFIELSKKESDGKQTAPTDAEPLKSVGNKPEKSKTGKHDKKKLVTPPKTASTKPTVDAPHAVGIINVPGEKIGVTSEKLPEK